MKKSPLKLVFSLIAFILISLPSGSNTAFAHPYSASFTTITPGTDETKVEFSIDTLSIIEHIESDEPHIEEEEIKENIDSIEEWVQTNLILKSNGEVIEGNLEELACRRKRRP